MFEHPARTCAVVVLLQIIQFLRFLAAVSVARGAAAAAVTGRFEKSTRRHAQACAVRMHAAFGHTVNSAYGGHCLRWKLSTIDS